MRKSILPLGAASYAVRRNARKHGAGSELLALRLSCLLANTVAPLSRTCLQVLRLHSKLDPNDFVLCAIRGYVRRCATGVLTVGTALCHCDLV